MASTTQTDPTTTTDATTDESTEAASLKVADGTRAVVTAVIEALDSGRPAAELAETVRYATLAQSRSQGGTLIAIAEAITKGSAMPAAPKANPSTRFFVALTEALSGGAAPAAITGLLNLVTMADDAELSPTLDVCGSMLRKVTPAKPADAKPAKSDKPADLKVA